jgi:hypothetical protein
MIFTFQMLFLLVTQLLFTFHLGVICTQQESASLSESIEIYGLNNTLKFSISEKEIIRESPKMLFLH